MGLGNTIPEENREWSINLFHPEDNNWEDNTWIVWHLRYLAEKIEKENPKIYSVGLNYTHNNLGERNLVHLFLEVKENVRTIQ